MQNVGAKEKKINRYRDCRSDCGLTLLSEPTAFNRVNLSLRVVVRKNAVGLKSAKN